MRLPPAIALIPARFASSRFPGKPLTPLLGKPMLQHVFERCQESGAFSAVYVATEDERIVCAAKHFGAKAILTSPDCRTGTERIAQALSSIPCPKEALVVNVQGDEPAVPPGALRQLVQLFDPSFEFATLVRPLQPEEASNPNVVKVAFSPQGRALYFSRSLIPFARSPLPLYPYWAHMGLYAYCQTALLRMAQHPPTPLEQTEMLEQLRALEMGMSCLCLPCHYVSVSVDTPEDVLPAETALKNL
ncbi:MAG: 3-deoxy-manno-octulosonate cytidylyltransferase [Proteobacteria bacterium]|nr:3-deoxy-manno-octulosonate cytidylyltransferase [Cystobacterineae bacterium]MCL2259637.1 3-deoxy-manno-octulosonate cytidylyltransferase [Cystobacterineae bacterium]MCL2313835.1 3-deoxy-manno-octulosonate cytidylyltransferase [Pseudomonadota bacterium]